MDKIAHNVELTSAETANLWTQYINDSSSICIHSIEKIGVNLYAEDATQRLKKYGWLESPHYLLTEIY